MCPFSHGVAFLIFFCAMHQVLGNPNSLLGTTTDQHVRRDLQGDSQNLKHLNLQKSSLQSRNHPSSRSPSALLQTPSVPKNVLKNADHTNSPYFAVTVDIANKLNISNANNKTQHSHSPSILYVPDAELAGVGSRHSVFKLQPNHSQPSFNRTRNFRQLREALKKTRLLVSGAISRKSMTPLRIRPDRFPSPKGEENTKASEWSDSSRMPLGIQQVDSSGAISDLSRAINRLRDVAKRRRKRAQYNNSDSQRILEESTNKQHRLGKSSTSRRKVHRANVREQHKLHKAQEKGPSKNNTDFSNNNLVTKGGTTKPQDEVESGNNRSVTEQVPLFAIDGKPISITDYHNLKKFWDVVAMKKLLARQAQWAYVCMVGLLLLMMWAMWYLGGLQRCRYRPDKIVYFQDHTHYMEMSEILRRKRKYLPMFNEPEWEDVLMTDRSTDP